jgi:sulfite exporter TauE/SafE
MNWTDLPVVFGLSLVASLHCAQMCGPIVVSFSLTGNGARGSCLAYNAGRILTYSVLGAVAGAIGRGMAILGHLAGIEEAAALACGILLVIAGLIMFGALRRPELVQIGPIRRAGKLLRRPGLAAKFGLGTLLGFLPCGLIYAALLKSMSAGSAVAGAANMLVFGLGTAVPLLALGVFSATFLRWFGKHSATLAATGVTLMGVALIWRGLKPICLMHL